MTVPLPVMMVVDGPSMDSSVTIFPPRSMASG